MKRIFICIIGLLMLGVMFTGTTKTSAGVLHDEDILAKSSDLEEVKAIEYTIISKAKSICRLNAAGTLSSEDIIIDYDNAVRVYTDYLFFADEEVSEQQVNEIADKCIDSWSYAWQVPVSSKSSGKVVGVVVARQPALSENGEKYCSEEGKKRIIENAGKYTATDADILTERNSLISYVKDVEENLPEGSKVRLFGTQPGFFQPVGAVISDGKISGIFSLGYYYSIQNHIDEKIEIGGIYDYKSLYPAITQIYKNNIDAAVKGLQTGEGIGMEMQTDNSFPVFWIVIIAGIMAIAVVIMIAFKRKSK